MAGKAWQQESKVAGHIVSQLGNQERMMVLVKICVGPSFSGCCCLHSRWEGDFSSWVNLSGVPSQTWPEVCLLDDSIQGQLDNEDSSP